jgi:transposase-like protein
MARRTPLSEEQKAAIRGLYFDTDTRVIAIAELYGLSERALYDEMDAWGWPRVRAERRRRQAEARAAERQARAAARQERTFERRAAATAPALPAPEGCAAPLAGAAPKTGPVDIAAIAATVGRRAAAELDRLGADLAAGRADARDGAATLASLARTIAAAQDLQRRAPPEPIRGPHDATSDEPPARSLDELHDELARTLDRIVAEEEAAGRDDFLEIVRSLPPA